MLHHTTDLGQRAEDIADHEHPGAKQMDYFAIHGWLECHDAVLRELAWAADAPAEGGEAG